MKKLKITCCIGILMVSLLSNTIISNASGYYAEEYKQRALELRLERSNEELAKRKESGDLLTKQSGVYYYNDIQRETYYNLNMSGVVEIMRNKGYREEDYPYWVRDDGVKMLGDYVMIAANLETHPRGSLVETSLGLAIVCDTGGFAKTYTNGVDIAVEW